MSKIQYTIRGIPPDVDQVIRHRALRTGKSFNATAIESLRTGTLGSKKNSVAKPSIFERLQGANTLNDKFDEAISEQAKIDTELWN